MFGLADYIVARLAAIVATAVISSFLIVRYRFVGVVISVTVGWVILYLAFNTWRAPFGVWDEDREDIGIVAPLLMAMWCLPVWGLVTWLRKKDSDQDTTDLRGK